MTCSRGFIAALLAFSVLKPCFGSDDLVLEILQFVANELPDEDCHRLLVSQKIRRREYYVDAAQGTKAPLFEDDSCIEGLLRWNSLEGTKATFSALAVRLRKMGHNDLAETVVCKDFEDETPKAKWKTNSTFSRELQDPTTLKEEWTYTLTVVVAVLNVLMIVLSAVIEIWSSVLHYQDREEALRENRVVRWGEELKDL